MITNAGPIRTRERRMQVDAAGAIEGASPSALDCEWWRIHHRVILAGSIEIQVRGEFNPVIIAQESDNKTVGEI